MSDDDEMDPTQTYVLEETILTKTRTLKELAELAVGTEPPDAEEALDKRSHDAPEE
jgi:hypothetical protein